MLSDNITVDESLLEDTLALERWLCTVRILSNASVTLLRHLQHAIAPYLQPLDHVCDWSWLCRCRD